MRTANHLDGVRIIVTGAAGGLGQATYLALQAAGAKVAGIDLHPKEDHIFAADITSVPNLSVAFELALGYLGGLDILINSAGIGWAHSSSQLPDDDLRKIFEVNFFGTWNVISLALPYLVRTKGHIINVSSGIAIISMAYGLSYCASKRAVNALSDVLRLEYRGRVTVTTMYPGYLKTGIHERNVQQGFSMEGVIPEDSLSEAAQAMVSSCISRRRTAYTSARTKLSLILASIFPRVFEHGLDNRVRASFQKRPFPTFFLREAPHTPQKEERDRR